MSGGPDENDEHDDGEDPGKRTEAGASRGDLTKYHPGPSDTVVLVVVIEGERVGGP